MLSSIIVDHLRRAIPTIPVLVLYLEETPKDYHDPENLLGSLIKQIIQLRGPSVPVSDVVRETWEKAIQFNTHPGLEELKELFKVS